MALENADFITDLVQSNPTPTDFINEGDDHLRLTKKVLQQSFPNIDGPVNSTPTDLNNGIIPVGGIIMWSGLLSALPGNWQICNGSSGTVNLQDRFIIASSGDAGVRPTGSQGGDHDNTLVEHFHGSGTFEAATHNHPGIALNTHAGEGAKFESSGNNYQANNTGNSGNLDVVGQSQTVGDNDGTEANMPLFYALAYVQRIT